MKRSLFTLAAVALFAFAAHCQDKDSKAKKESAPAVKDDGTAASSSSGDVNKKDASPKKEEAPKKNGTRMAINEKGLPGNSTKKETKKD